MKHEVYQTLHELYMMLYDLNFLSAFVRLFLAMLLGGILGYGREKKHLPAGFRTYMVVCLGSALSMMVGIYVTDITGAAAASRPRWSAASASWGQAPFWSPGRTR